MAPAGDPVDALPIQTESSRDLVLITIDTLRADAVGFSGSDRVSAQSPTPNLDQLADQGVVYDQAHAHNVMTLPSHANILTGQLPYYHGVRDNAGYVLPPDLPTAATQLNARGFKSAAFVAAFPLDARFGLGRGFDLYDDTYPEGNGQGFAIAERSAQDTVSAAIEWWRSTASAEARFLWLHVYDPHAPYLPPEPFRSRFSSSPYLGEVAAVDHALAPLLESLTLSNRPTTLIVTSDHGEALGEHGEDTHGLFAYEPTLRVPLLVWSNRMPTGQGRRSTRAAQHVDLLPTLLDAAGVEVPEGLAGLSLFQNLPTDGASDPEQRLTYFEVLGPALNRGWAPLFGVLQNREKFIELPLPELYDLSQDPGERDNRLASNPAATSTWQTRLPTAATWPPVQLHGSSARANMTSAERDALSALGYLASDETTVGSNFTAADDPKNLLAVDQAIQEFVTSFQNRQLDRALRAAQQTVELRPRMGLGYLNLAQAQLELDDLRAAVQTMTRAVELGVETPTLRRQLALSLAEIGNPEAGLEILRPLTANNNEDPDTLNALGMVLTEAGRYQEARAALERVFLVDERNPDAHANLARLGIFASQWSFSERHARAALELNPALALTWNHLALSLFNQQRVDEALAAFERSLSLDPKDYDVLFNLGLIAANVGRADLARPAIERFIAEAPRDRYGQDIERMKERLKQL